MRNISIYKSTFSFGFKISALGAPESQSSNGEVFSATSMRNTFIYNWYLSILAKKQEKFIYSPSLNNKNAFYYSKSGNAIIFPCCSQPFLIASSCNATILSVVNGCVLKKSISNRPLDNSSKAYTKKCSASCTCP